ncbi:MAG TPA: NifU family protein [Acidimicrobiales bacterium]|jgi:Fe-S cluster biogenesis protein NfuA|nr:NifU family protein [Acidimicrobiales bacterium]
MPEPRNLRQSGERIEQALSELQQSADTRTLNLAEEVLRLVSELYGAGLARVLEIVREEAPELVDALASDELVASLLLVQGLHPDSVEARVEAALESVRPFLGQHGGDVALLAIDDELGAVKLRLLGSCDGCPSSAATLRGAVEVAILEKAPEVTRIVVEESAPANGNDDHGAVPITLGLKPTYDECPAGVSAP